MPLVIPGINNNKNNTILSEWQNKLMGKKLGETNDNVTFAKKDLPQNSRVVGPGDMVSMDHNPDRLNVHLAEDGTVKEVKHG